MAEYIEREALKQMITDEQIERHVSSGNHGYEIGYHNGLTMAQAMIIKASSADVVEVKHGLWVSHDLEVTFSCSECDFTTDFRLSNYCPNCGARMGGE